MPPLALFVRPLMLRPARLMPTMPLDIMPLPLPIDANNESVGLTDAAGDDREPMMLGVGIDQMFGDSPSPSSTSMDDGSLRFQMLINSGSVITALFDDVDDDDELVDEHADDPVDDGIIPPLPL